MGTTVDDGVCPLHEDLWCGVGRRVLGVVSAVARGAVLILRGRVVSGIFGSGLGRSGRLVEAPPNSTRGTCESLLLACVCPVCFLQRPVDSIRAVIETTRGDWLCSG